MKTPSISFTTIFFVTLACAFGTAGAARQDPARAEIAAQSRALMTAIEKGDAAAAADLFTSDARISASMPGGVIIGRDAILKFWQSATDGGVRALVLTPADFLGQGDVRVETGSYQALGADRRELGRGQYLFAWVKEGGAWKISRDFATPDAMPVASMGDSDWQLPAEYTTRLKRLGESVYDARHGVMTLYANDVVAAVADQQAARYPDGSMLLMEFAEPLHDGEDQLLRDGHAQPLRGSVKRIDMMRRGAEAQGGEASRAGAWQFASFKPDGTMLVAPSNAEQCAACHLKAGPEKDFVYRTRSWKTARQD